MMLLQTSFEIFAYIDIQIIYIYDVYHLYILMYIYHFSLRPKKKPSHTGFLGYVATNKR